MVPDWAQPGPPAHTQAAPLSASHWPRRSSNTRLGFPGSPMLRSSFFTLRTRSRALNHARRMLPRPHIPAPQCTSTQTPSHTRTHCKMKASTRHTSTCRIPARHPPHHHPALQTSKRACLHEGIARPKTFLPPPNPQGPGTPQASLPGNKQQRPYSQQQREGVKHLRTILVRVLGILRIQLGTRKTTHEVLDGQQRRHPPASSPQSDIGSTTTRTPGSKATQATPVKAHNQLGTAHT